MTSQRHSTDRHATRVVIAAPSPVAAMKACKAKGHGGLVMLSLRG